MQPTNGSAMRYSQPYLVKFLPFIAIASLTFNIFFLTNHHKATGKKWISSNSTSLGPSQASETIWPSPFGPFTVLPNYVPRVLNFDYNNSITFSTHATPDFLHHANELASRWKGPISIAIYAPGTDIDIAIQVIGHLRQCGNKFIRNYVSFHLFFERNKYPNPFNRLKFPYNSSPFNCLWPVDKLANYTYRRQHRLIYPVNVARNIARSLSTTHYVLTCDLELYPSLDLIPMFLEMVRREKVVKSRHVYVLPVYEIEKKVELPRDKQELVQLVSAKKAVSFHRYMCRKCHQIPYEKNWLKAPSNKSLEVFSIVRKRPSSKWEPIYVGTNDDPLYDERLSWEGMADKLSQLYEMCLMDYRLYILDDAFLTHAPGIKKNWKENNLWRDKYIRHRLQIVNKIKNEIDERHPANKNCTF